MALERDLAHELVGVERAAGLVVWRVLDFIPRDAARGCDAEYGTCRLRRHVPCLVYLPPWRSPFALLHDRLRLDLSRHGALCLRAISYMAK